MSSVDNSNANKGELAKKLMEEMNPLRKRFESLKSNAENSYSTTIRELADIIYSINENIDLVNEELEVDEFKYKVDSKVYKDALERVKLLDKELVELDVKLCNKAGHNELSGHLLEDIININEVFFQIYGNLSGNSANN